MGRPKAFVPVAGVPLLVLVVRVAAQIADEVVVVTKLPQVQAIRELVRETAYVVADVQR
ncbi:MAG: NTP transferase domain-containing protein, partial [Candidatus Thermoplasmatota archaeon]